MRTLRVTAALVSLLVLASGCSSTGVTAPSASTSPTPSASADASTSTAESEAPAVAAPADLAAAGKIRSGWAEFAPYEFRDPADGEVKGLIVDLWNHLGESWGLDVELVEDGWPTITTALATDKFDVTALVDTAKRRETIDFSNPLFQAEYRLLTRAGDGYKTFSDVDKPGKKIVVTTGSSTEEVTRGAVKNAEIVSVPEVGAALLQLKGGQVDAMASTTDYLLPKLAENPDLAVTEDAFAYAAWAVAVAKNNPDLLASVNAWVEETKASGAIKSMLDSYKMVGIFVSPPGPLQP